MLFSELTSPLHVVRKSLVSRRMDYWKRERFLELVNIAQERESVYRGSGADCSLLSVGEATVCNFEDTENAYLNFKYIYEQA